MPLLQSEYGHSRSRRVRPIKNVGNVRHEGRTLLLSSHCLFGLWGFEYPLLPSTIIKGILIDLRANCFHSPIDIERQAAVSAELNDKDERETRGVKSERSTREQVKRQHRALVADAAVNQSAVSLISSATRSEIE